MKIELLIIFVIVFCCLQNFLIFEKNTEKTENIKNTFDTALNHFSDNPEVLFMLFPAGMPIFGTNPLFEYSGVECIKKFVPGGWFVHSTLYQEILTKKGLNYTNILVDIVDNPNIIIINYNEGTDLNLTYIQRLEVYLNRHYSEKFEDKNISVDLLWQVNDSLLNPPTDVVNVKLYHIVTTNKKKSSLKIANNTSRN